MRHRLSNVRQSLRKSGTRPSSSTKASRATTAAPPEADAKARRGTGNFLTRCRSREKPTVRRTASGPVVLQPSIQIVRRTSPAMTLPWRAGRPPPAQRPCSFPTCATSAGKSTPRLNEYKAEQNEPPGLRMSTGYMRNIMNCIESLEHTLFIHNFHGLHVAVGA